MDGKIAYIYYLYDPDDFETGYVGKTEQPKKRYCAHMEIGNLKANTPKNTWIKHLLNNNKKPLMVILETSNSENWPEAERWWIAHMRSLSYRLKNSDDGGMGGENRIIGDETRRKLSEFHTGKAWNKGREFSKEWRENLSAGQRRRHDNLEKLGIKISFTEEQRTKIARGQAAISDDTVREIRDVLKNTLLDGKSIGRIFGLSGGTIQRVSSGTHYWWVKNFDGSDYIPPTVRRKYIPTNGSLNRQQVLEIRQAHKNGLVYGDIGKLAKRLDTTVGVITGIIHRKTYKWVDDEEN